MDNCQMSICSFVGKLLFTPDAFILGVVAFPKYLYVD